MSSIPSGTQIRNTISTHLDDLGIIGEVTRWQLMRGGRTNVVWKISAPNKTLACKLYTKGTSSPLFPNSHRSEILALTHLNGSGLSPELVAEFPTQHGHVIVYDFLDGTSWHPAASGLATRLKDLHDYDIPKGVRRAPFSIREILDQGDMLLSQCQSKTVERLVALRPPADKEDSLKRVFIHGDLVASNVIMTKQDAHFIDWQCPAAGAACDDIATLFSPAMSHLYGRTVANDGQLNSFLDEYNDSAVENQFFRRRPYYTWRMATYCLWKSERGASDYSQALEMELNALGQFQPKGQRSSIQAANGRSAKS